MTSVANPISPQQEKSIIDSAKCGDEKAFATLISIYRARLRNVIRKMVGHPEDCEDLFQETLIKANGALAKFKGDSNFGTWLCAIGVNLSLDFLRKQKLWRSRAQVIYGNQCYDNPDWGAEVYHSTQQVEFEFDVFEHIAYCWSCVGRSLPAEQNAAIVLREFLELSNRECAKELKLTESVFRHTLSDARKAMQTKFDDLCALVNKSGVCYQCVGLRDGCAPEKQGSQPPVSFSLEQRIQWVKSANLDNGKSQNMHDLFYRRTKEVEDKCLGDENETSKCREGH